METFSALLAICAGNSSVPGEFPTQRPVTRSFDVYFDLRSNKCLSKQSWGWWFETLSSSLWRHRNVQRGASCRESITAYTQKNLPVFFTTNFRVVLELSDIICVTIIQRILNHLGLRADFSDFLDTTGDNNEEFDIEGSRMIRSSTALITFKPIQNLQACNRRIIPYMLQCILVQHVLCVQGHKHNLLLNCTNSSEQWRYITTYSIAGD